MSSVILNPKLRKVIYLEYSTENPPAGRGGGIVEAVVHKSSISEVFFRTANAYTGKPKQSDLALLQFDLQLVFHFNSVSNQIGAVDLF